MKMTFLVKPDNKKYYPMISHGKGVYLYDNDGHVYFDGCSGAISCNIGHGVEEIKQAAMAQFDKITFSFRDQFMNEPAEKLAEALIKKATGMHWCYFVNSGSEAVEASIRFATQYWKTQGKNSKKIILSRNTSYHGTTVAALNISGHYNRRTPFAHILNQHFFIQSTAQDNFEENNELISVKDFENKILQLGAENVAAFIIEPVVGAAGAALVPPKNYLSNIRLLCDKYDILLIADEVMTGLGRTGAWFGCDHWHVIPDIMVLGKGISAGYTPIAAILLTEKVYLQSYPAHSTGHTFSANPLSTAIGLAVLNYIDQHNLVHHAKVMGKLLMKKLNTLLRRYSFIKEIRGKGLLIGMQLINPITNNDFDADMNMHKVLVNIAMSNGLIIYPSRGNEKGDAIMIAPPLTINHAEIDELVEKINITLMQFSKQLLTLV